MNIVRQSLIWLVIVAPTVTPGRSQTQSSDATTPVVLVLQRNYRLSVFSAADLKLLGYYVTGGLGDGMSVRADGRVVYLNQASVGNPNSCCSSQALDLASGRMCLVSEFAAGAFRREGRDDRVRVPELRRPETFMAGRFVVAFERYGSGLKMRNGLPASQQTGGAFVINPATGGVVRRVLPEMFFRDLIASADGRDLYGVQDWPQADPVRFVRVDVPTGAVRAEIALHPETRPGALVEQWTLAFVDMPSSLVPRGETQTRPCR